MMDRVGIGWRPEIAGGILLHLDSIDVVEVIVDDYVNASPKVLRSLRTLASMVPVVYHGVSLGMASAHPIDDRRLSKIARTLEVLEPSVWSEHLAFVRAGGHEIGHLAAPPRTEQTIEGAIRNYSRVVEVTGLRPALENIATLIDPPGSTLHEAAWVSAIVHETRGGLLLDLHNLYANALNFGFGPLHYLRMFPLERVQLIHLSGGHWIPEPQLDAALPGRSRLLDDHVHDVPQDVFDLLRVVAASVSQPLTVIIERDGKYPELSFLVEQIHTAKRMLAEGRAMRASTQRKAV